MPRSNIHAPGSPTHPPTVLLVALVTQVTIALVPAARSSIPALVKALGAAFIVGGLLLNVLATRQFSRRRTPVRPSAEALALVTDGVFRWSRNPMYLGMASIIAGSALALASPWALLVLPLFVVWMNRLIRWEEARLGAAFGDRYRIYATRVRRWL
jgi:protein-S-isoprenylcysteine O-methyltransferase Ste14